MDGLSVLAVVGNVMQVIDTAGKVVALVCQISKQGTTSENAELEKNSERLFGITKSLTERLGSQSISDSKNSTEMKVRDLAENCCDAVEELQTELSKLKIRDGKRDVLLASFKAIRRQPTVEKLRKRLDVIQGHLNSGLLAQLSEELDVVTITQTKEFGRLDEALKRLIFHIAFSRHELEEHVTSQNIATQQAIAIENVSTRECIGKDIADFRSSLVSDAQREGLLQSLYTGNMNARRNQVSDAALNTFTWVLEEDTDSPTSDLRDWLGNGEGVFLIQGKAGSGKSTLIKFMIESEKTMTLLSNWCRGWRPRILSHFFWLAGTESQRSLHGFLCSILYQMLQQDQDLIDLLLNLHSDLKYYRSSQDWNVKRLTAITKDLLEWSGTGTAYCIFIDGLDEFGDPNNYDKQVELINALASYPNAKICVSSRPIANLRDHFIDAPSVSLQDLTQRDLYRHVEHEILKMQSGRLSLIDPMHMFALIEEIVDKAHGVFLWVHLALKEVRRGLSNQDSQEELQQRISKLPEDVNKLYEDMLRRLGDDWWIYMREAAFYLKMCYIATKTPLFSLNLVCMTLAYCLNKNLALMRPLVAGDRVEMTQRCERIAARIVSCCGGLLEVRRGSVESLFYCRDPYNTFDLDQREPLEQYQYYTVTFFHRTVLDFLETPSGREILTMHPEVDDDLLMLADVHDRMVTEFNRRARWPECIFKTDQVRRHYEKMYDIHICHLELSATRRGLKSSVVQRVIKIVDEAFMKLLLSHGIGTAYKQQNTKYFACLSNNHEFMDIHAHRISCRLPHGLIDNQEDSVGTAALVLEELTDEYLSYLLLCAAQRLPSARALIAPLLKAGANPNQSFTYQTKLGTFFCSPWDEMLYRLLHGSRLDFPEDQLASFVKYKACLEHKLIVFMNDDKWSATAYRPGLRMKGLDPEDCRGIPHIISVKTAGTVLKDILLASGRGDLIEAFQLPESSNLDAQMHLLSCTLSTHEPRLELGSDSSCSGLTSIRVLANADFNLITEICQGNEDWFLRDPGRTLLQKLTNQYKPLRLLEWLRQEGWTAPRDDSTFPQYFSKRFKDEYESVQGEAEGSKTVACAE